MNILDEIKKALEDITVMEVYGSTAFGFPVKTWAAACIKTEENFVKYHIIWNQFLLRFLIELRELKTNSPNTVFISRSTPKIDFYDDFSLDSTVSRFMFRGILLDKNTGEAVSFNSIQIKPECVPAGIIN